GHQRAALALPDHDAGEFEAARQVVGDATEMQAHGRAVDAIRVPRGHFDISYRENRPAPVNSLFSGEADGRAAGGPLRTGTRPFRRSAGRTGDRLRRPAPASSDR